LLAARRTDLHLSAKETAAMQTARELFIHEITDLLDAEQKLVKALTEMERDSKNPELKKAFGDHKRQTEGQVKRIQQVFKQIGEQPEATECKGIKGLVEERNSFKEEDPSDDIQAIFDCGAAIKVETYEICSYNSVISLAEQLDLEDAIDLLQQNLTEEEETLELLQDIQDQLEPEQLGTDEQAADDDDDEEDEDEEDLEDEEEDEEDEEALDERPAKNARKTPAKSAPKKGKTKRVA
jgi:ferritin-like metal-binding protein YciE